MQLAGRPGGAGANLARGLAGTGRPTRLIGERTIIGPAEDRLAGVPIPGADIRRTGLLTFAAWHESFQEPLAELAARGLRIACVPFDPGDRPFPARWVVGSRSQLPSAAQPDPWDFYRSRSDGDLEAVVVTDGTRPVRAYRPSGELRVDVPRVPVVDATGAGDSFLAGLVARLGDGADLEEALHVAVRWAGATVQLDGSAPALHAVPSAAAGTPDDRTEERTQSLRPLT